MIHPKIAIPLSSRPTDAAPTRVPTGAEEHKEQEIAGSHPLYRTPVFPREIHCAGRHRWGKVRVGKV